MLSQLLLASFMALVTTVTHLVGLAILVRVLRSHNHIFAGLKILPLTLLLTAAIGILAIHTIEIWTYAWLYDGLGCFRGCTHPRHPDCGVRLCPVQICTWIGLELLEAAPIAEIVGRIAHLQLILSSARIDVHSAHWVTNDRPVLCDTRMRTALVVMIVHRVRHLRLRSSRRTTM